MLTTTRQPFLSAYKATIRMALEETHSGIMPTLYLLHRQAVSIRSAEGTMITLNAPDLSGTSLIMGDSVVEIGQIGKAIISLQQEISDELDELLFRQPCFNIEPDAMLYDSPRTREPGYSFVEDTRNPWNTATFKSVLDYILDTPQVFNQFAYMHAGIIVWHAGQCLTWRYRIFALQQKLMAAIILSYGGPARGMELVSHVYRNIPAGSIRNVFVLFQILVLRGTYNKTSSLTLSDQTMLRIPPLSIGHLLIRFLVYLRPLYTVWQEYFTEHPDNKRVLYENSHYYLFAGLEKPLESQDVRKTLREITLKHLGVSLGIKEWRQVIAYFFKMNEKLFDTSSHQTMQSLIGKQFGHDAITNQFHYGQDARAPEGFDYPSLLQTAHVSAVYHIMLGLPPILLERLERGRAFQEHVRSTISHIQDTRWVHLQPPLDSTLRSATNVSTEYIIDGICQRLSSQIINENKRHMGKCVAAVAEIFRPGQVYHQQLSNDGVPTLMHPFAFNKLQQLLALGKFDGFKNTQQAQVTQLMWEQKHHIAYISPTGKLCQIPSFIIIIYSIIFSIRENPPWIAYSTPS